MNRLPFVQPTRWTPLSLPVSSRQEMFPHLLTEDTRVITVSERRDATDNCGGVVIIPSIIWVQSRLANWPT
jgi:hypothetical protein